jgi:dienelactone hydrolase
VRRRRLVALATAALAVAIGAWIASSAAPSPARHSSRGSQRDTATTAPTGSRRGHASASHRLRQVLSAHVAVGLRLETFVDRSRTIRLANGKLEPRTLVTEVRYPAAGPAGANDVRNAPAARAAGPYPLVIFGHGFAVTPAPYAPLLDAWARAGYIVAAPVFPLASPLAPGGPTEADLVNEPADMSFVISRMLAQSTRANGPFSGLLERNRIAVTGQSDGGDTALAVAFDEPLRDGRVTAVVVLSGAEIPQLGAFAFPRQGPPLLATQGSADTINLPSATTVFFSVAPRPKFLLTLVGATHLPPYSSAQPYLGIVERVTVAFLERYLKNQPAGLHRMLVAGRIAGLATLLDDP